jgi:hypothetical protein
MTTKKLPVADWSFARYTFLNSNIHTNCLAGPEPLPTESLSTQSKTQKAVSRKDIALCALLRFRVLRTVSPDGPQGQTVRYGGTVRLLATHEFHHYLIENPPKSQNLEPKSQNHGPNSQNSVKILTSKK